MAFRIAPRVEELVVESTDVLVIGGGIVGAASAYLEQLAVGRGGRLAVTRAWLLAGTVDLLRAVAARVSGLENGECR